MSKKHKYKLIHLLHDLRQVVKIDPVDATNAIVSMGNASQKNLDPNVIRIAVWNVFKGKGHSHFAKDFAALLQISDLVLVQEALWSSTMEQAMRHPDFLTLHCASYLRRDGLRDGLATLSRSSYVHDILKIPSLRNEPVFRTPKSTLISFYPLAPGQSLMVINIHARLFRSLKQSTEELDHLMVSLPIHEGPVILAGDFNTFSQSYRHKTFTYLESHGFNHVAMDEDRRGKYRSLDHIFVRGLRSLAAQVLGDITSSDHAPLHLTAQFEPKIT